MTGTKRIVLVLLCVGLGAGVAGGAPSAQARDTAALEADVSHYVWERRDGSGADAEEAVALRVRAMAPNCRVNRSFIRTEEGAWAVLTEESAIEPGGVTAGASYRGISPEAGFLEMVVQAPIDLSAHTVGSATAKAFEEAVDRLSEREVEEAVAGQTVSVRRGGGAVTELRGIADDARLPQRVLERLAEAEGLTPRESLMSTEAVDQLAEVLRIVWAQPQGILLFDRESLLFETLQEVYPDALGAARLAGDGLSMRGVRVVGRDAALEVANRWADDFQMVDPLEGTCLAGRLWSWSGDEEGGAGSQPGHD